MDRFSSAKNWMIFFLISRFLPKLWIPASNLFLEYCSMLVKVSKRNLIFSFFFFFTRNEKLTETIRFWQNEDTFHLVRIKPRFANNIFPRSCFAEIATANPNSTRYGNSVCKLSIYPRLKFLDTRYPRLSRNLPPSPAVETKSNWSEKESYVRESVAPVLRKLLLVEFHSERGSKHGDI